MVFPSHIGAAEGVESSGDFLSSKTIKKTKLKCEPLNEGLWIINVDRKKHQGRCAILESCRGLLPPSPILALVTGLATRRTLAFTCHS